jgi:hypothetical protein
MGIIALRTAPGVGEKLVFAALVGQKGDMYRAVVLR